MEVIYCPKCEASSSPDSVFCSLCGNQLTATRVKHPTEPPRPIKKLKSVAWQNCFSVRTMVFLVVGIPTLVFVVYSLLDSRYAWSADRRGRETWHEDQARAKAEYARMQDPTYAKKIELERLQRQIDDLLKKGLLTHVTVYEDTARAPLATWLGLSIDDKQDIVRLLSIYFRANDRTGRVSVLTSTNDSEIASYVDVWTGIKIHY